MKKSLRKSILFSVVLLSAVIGSVYILDSLPGWLEDYGEYRTDLVMNRVAEYYLADSPKSSEVKGCLPTPTSMACVEIHKEKSGWTTITGYPKKGDERPIVSFYNLYSPGCCWGYEIVWTSGQDADKTDKYVRQARRDVLANVNMVTREFPGNLMPF